MSLFFYDLETSGLDSRWQRIMQFAGQRTNKDLVPVGKPIDVLIKLTDDILPEPDAVMVTGITPQATLHDGISEAEFLKILHEKVFTPDTVMLGFNSLRFDDEFLRHTLYRNFYDPYEREYTEGMSRWDVLDMSRMMRALRPEGIKWPTGDNGKPTNRLESLTEANSIKHDDAHAALADVNATIELTKLIKSAQPKLYDHLFKMKDKKNLKKLLEIGSQPVVHSSGKLPSEYLKTSVVVPIAPHPVNKNAVLVFDLRHSPKPFADMDSKELSEAAFTPAKELIAKNQQRLPIKAVHINKSPAVAPLSVLDEASQERINLSLTQVKTHLKELKEIKGFDQRVIDAWEQQEPLKLPDDSEGQLYGGGFINDNDKKQLKKLRAQSAEQLASWQPRFDDERLQSMLLGYKARNYPEILSGDEQSLWQQYRLERLNDSERGITFAKFENRLSELAKEHAGDKKKEFLIEELHLYAQSITPFENETLV